jgi:hypothetical protein
MNGILKLSSFAPVLIFVLICFSHFLGQMQRRYEDLESYFTFFTVNIHTFELKLHKMRFFHFL